MNSINKLLIFIGWAIVLITTYLTVIWGYKDYPQRIAGVMVLSAISFAYFKKGKHLNLFISIGLFLLMFQLISIHQSNNVTFNPNSTTSTEISLSIGFTIGSIAVALQPIYLVLFLIYSYLFRKDIISSVEDLVTDKENQG